MRKIEYQRLPGSLGMMADVMNKLKEYSVEEVALICRKYKARSALVKTRTGTHKIPEQ